MSRLIKAAIGLTSALFLVATLEAPVATAGAIKPGPLLLAQEVKQEKAKAPIPKSPLPKPEPPKSLKGPQPQVEKRQRKTRSLGHMPDEVNKAGTKKIGGQAIRAKETPKGE